MKSQQHLLLFLVFLILVIFTSLVSHDLQAIWFRGTRLDSIGHMVGFFGLTWLLQGVFKFPLIPLSMCLIFYAALTEIGQWYLGYRNAEMSDFIADVVGITAFVALKWLKIMYFTNKAK